MAFYTPAPGRLPTWPKLAGTIMASARHAYASGQANEGLKLLEKAARLRPVFTRPTSADLDPPARLAYGSARPTIICLPSIPSVTGVQEYARFASCVQPNCDIWVLPAPGYVDGQALPASPAALVDAQAKATSRCVRDQPFALLGYSSGGWIAHALAHHLQESGRPVSAVILLDTPNSGGYSGPLLDEMVKKLSDRIGAGVYDDANLTALAAYARMLDGWIPSPITAATLFIRATEHLCWALPHDLIDIPGTHFTMLGEHALVAANAAGTWLSNRFAFSG